MKLHRVRIRNFRCYREETSISFDDITGMVGKNDAGKSAVMEALDIFLNDSTLDKDDASKSGDPKDLTIICEFCDLPAKVVIDDANPTSLAGEFLLNEAGHLEIHKNYSGHLATPKLVSVSAWAVHPAVDGAKDLLQLKNPALKARAKELGVDLADVDQKINAQLRQHIREHIDELAPTAASVPLNEENAKSIWTGLKTYLPVFALFKSDRSSTDQDPEAQDPLKAATSAPLPTDVFLLSASPSKSPDEQTPFRYRQLATGANEYCDAFPGEHDVYWPKHPSDSKVTVPSATSCELPEVSFNTFQPMELCPTSNEKIKSRFPVALIAFPQYKLIRLIGTKTKLNNAAQPTVSASDVISVLKKEQVICSFFSIMMFAIDFLMPNHYPWRSKLPRRI